MKHLATLILFVAAGCGDGTSCPYGNEVRRTRAQLCVDRDSVNFAPESIDNGVRIGASRPGSLGITNGGLEVLKLSTVNIAGDLDFTLSEDAPLEVQSGAFASLRLTFAPRELSARTATLTIVSNAENFPTRDIPLRGCGAPDAGGTTSGCR